MFARTLTACAALALVAAPAHAALKKGATAPEFVAKGAQAGKPVTFDLKRVTLMRCYYLHHHHHLVESHHHCHLWAICFHYVMTIMVWL